MGHENNKKYFARKKFIINPSFQYTVMGVMIFIAVISVLSLYISQAVFFSDFVILADRMGLPATHPFREFLEIQKSSWFNIFLVTSIINMTVILAIGAVLTNRIAGPIYRILLSLKNIEQTGEVSEIKIRKNDFFQELPDAINKVISKK